MTADDRKREFLRHLGECSGVVRHACARTGISHATYYGWRRRDPEFAAQCDIITGSCRAQAEERRAAAHGQEAAAGDVEAVPLPIPYRGEPVRKIVRRHADFLRKCMRDGGLYTPSAEAQIRATARLYASMEVMASEIGVFAPVQLETSREGNLRLAVNPVHDVLRRQAETYTSMLKALGLNFDSKAKPQEEDGLADFLREMNRDD